jgi:hypothetical protein
MAPTATCSSPTTTGTTCVTAWTQDISQGELIHDGYDEALTADPCQLRFLYRGVDPAKRGGTYSDGKTVVGSGMLAGTATGFIARLP